MAIYEGNELLKLINRLRATFIARDEGVFLPFNNYGSLGVTGITAFQYFALASATRIYRLISWTQAVFVSGTNNGSNYWTIQLDDGATAFASFNTSAAAGSTWITNVRTTFTQPTAIPPSGWIGVECIPTGTPGALRWAAPALRVM
jgi:hypothetical protein